LAFPPRFAGGCQLKLELTTIFMKKIAILSLSAFIFTACGASSQINSTNISTTQNSSNSLLVSSHSTENSAVPNATIVPKSDTKSKWTQSGNPIDVSNFDAEIKQAELTLMKIKTRTGLKKDASGDSSNIKNAEKALAVALVNRGLALTDARQYASALGDYRKAQKLDPTNEDAKKWIEQIIGIYESINRDYPKEGEEPPPLPFKKDTADANKKASL
jgi:tetratricopeptide (TPR) repeat protein